ncbi:Fatty acyl-CoA reductase 3 [Euphorbia peplus]|nr:Fatty acyl-CoA reductase 3 [Euphorbia peplus]
MELGNIVKFLDNKSILVTGVTGFLAKVFIEKILRVQPNVKKLYLLLRDSDYVSASERFHNEVLTKELFRIAKEKLGENFSSIIKKKIEIISGDVAYEDLGIKDSFLKEEMKNELDFVLNFAGTTSFDERYDVALGTNTTGAKNVLCFAKTCPKLKLLVHISTAYVCGEISGFIQENPYHLNEGISGLDIKEEKDLIDQKLEELKSQRVTQVEIKHAMKNLGMQRAKKHGWPNTYVFTKAMGEMMIQDLKGDMNVIIIRPAIVASTYKEPFPGWIENVRTIDALIVAAGMGKMKFVALDLEGIIDVIPADMVVNAIVVAMVAHANKPYNSSNGIYHLGSSSRNPLRNYKFRDYIYHYFTNNPYVGKDGKPIKCSQPTIILNSMASYHRYMAFHYLPLLKGLKLGNTIFFHYFDSMCNTLDKRIKSGMRLMELYRPYLFSHGRFEDSNTKKLLKALKENSTEIDTFYFDVIYIDWDDYFLNIHIPGLLQYVVL